MGAAIVAAYSELGHVSKDATGHHGTYATIGSVLDTVKPILHKHGLAVVQMCGDSDPGFVTVITMLVHESGEVAKDSGLRMPAPNDPQKVGSALSYARRYGLMTMMGLAALDDDAQGASDAIRKENEPHPNSDRVKDVVAALKALDTSEKEAVKVWAEGHSLAPKALLDDDKWLDRVETFLTEMTGS
jgi:hypothetical protein